jgi:hypothetical protein
MEEKVVDSNLETGTLEVCFEIPLKSDRREQKVARLTGVLVSLMPREGQFAVGMLFTAFAHEEEGGEEFLRFEVRLDGVYLNKAVGVLEAVMNEPRSE